MTALFLLSALVSMIVSLFRWLDRSGRIAHPFDAVTALGFVGLFMTWGVFVPTDVWATLTHQPESWIFGSEQFDGGIVETATVLFYALAIACALVLFRRASSIYGAKAAPMWRVILMMGILALLP